MNNKKKGSGARTALIAFSLITLIVLVLVISARISSFGLWPGTEGLDAGVTGYQTVAGGDGRAGYTQTDEQFPTTPLPSHSRLSPRYAWTQWPTVDVYNTLIRKTEDYGAVTYAESQTLRVERQTPTRDESVSGKQIEYWVYDKDPSGNNRSTHFVGTVVPWTFNVQISIVPGSGDDLAYFKDGEAVWFGIGTKKWNRAYSTEVGYDNWAGWSIPLSIYVEQYNPIGKWPENDNMRDTTPKTEWVTDCVQITPDYSGRTVTLFSDPEQPVSLDKMWYQGGLDLQGLNQALNSLNGTFRPDPRPDTEFANHAYFKFTLTRFKPFEEVNWMGVHVATWFPSVYFRLRVYYLELGQFTYVEEAENLPAWDIRVWGKTFTPFQLWWDSFFSALGWWNPFAIFGPWAGLVAFFFTLFVIGIVILILLAIFAPWVLPLIFHGFKQAAKGTRDVYDELKGKKHS